MVSPEVKERVHTYTCTYYYYIYTRTLESLINVYYIYIFIYIDTYKREYYILYEIERRRKKTREREKMKKHRSNTMSSRPIVKKRAFFFHQNNIRVVPRDKQCCGFFEPSTPRLHIIICGAQLSTSLVARNPFSHRFARIKERKN